MSCDLTYVGDKEATELASKVIDGKRVVTNLYLKYLTRKVAYGIKTFGEFLRKSYPDRLKQYSNLNNKRITLPNTGSDKDIMTMYEKDKSQYIDVNKPRLEGSNWVYYILKPRDYHSDLYPAGEQLEIDLNPSFNKKKAKEKDLSTSSYKRIFQQLEGKIARYKKDIGLTSDKSKQEEIRKNLSAAEEQLESLTKQESIAKILQIAGDDIKNAEDLLTDPDVTENDLYNIKRVTDFWLDGTLLRDLFDPEDIKEGSEASDVFFRLRNRALVANREWEDVVYNRIKELVEKHTGKSYSDVEWTNMTENMNEIGIGQALFRDMSSVNNVIIQVADKIIKEANVKAELEAGVIIKTVDKLLSKVRGKVGKDFDLYQQRDGKGRKNGNLVYRFAQKFFDAAKGSKPRNWSKKDQVLKYKTFKRDNMLIFDYRKLFYNDFKTLFPSDDTFNSKEIEDSLNELKTALGEKGYNFYYKKAEKKWKDFKQRYQAKRDELETEHNGNQAIVETAMIDWELKYSPINYTKDIYERTSIFAKNRPKFEGFEYILEVPRKFDDKGNNTGYYDKNFETIEGDEDLLNFYNYLTDKLDEFKSFYSKDITEGLQENFIPDLPRTMLENMSSIKGMTKGLFDTLINSISQENFYYPMVDESGRQIRSLPVYMMGKSRYSSLTDGEMIALKQEARSKFPEGSQEYIDYYKVRKQEIIATKVEGKSFDLGNILKALALTSLTYKHKSDVEDSIRLINVLINDAAEIQVNPDGTPRQNRFGIVSTTNGLNNLRSSFEYMMDAFYGKTKNIKETNKKLYKANERKIKKSLEAEIKKIDSSIKDGSISEKEGKESIEKINKDIDKLGQSFVWSKFWDLMGKYMHVKGMGWNTFSATTNYMVALAGNYTMAASNRYFGSKELAWAYIKMKNSLVSNIGASTGESTKITNLLNRMGVGNTDADTVYGNKTLNRYKKTPAGKALSIVLPYELTSRVEFINQGATVLAMMKKIKIKNLKGEDKSLYDAFDQEGNWNTEEFGENTGWDLTGQEAINFTLKVQDVIKQIHGNYDPNSATMIKKTALGRQLMMFRNWIPEGIASRFEGERESVILGDKVKGRYRSYKAEHAIPIYGQYKLVKDYIKALKGEYTKGSPEDAALDSANLKRNIRELLIYGVSLAAILTMRGLKDDDDEEKGWDTYAMNFYLNSFTRLQTDLEFFISPIAAEKITRNSLPIAQLITDLALWVKAVRRYLEGRDGDNGAYTLEHRTIGLFPTPVGAYQKAEPIFEKEY